jgi:uncharacterized protein YegL
MMSDSSLPQKASSDAVSVPGTGGMVNALRTAAMSPLYYSRSITSLNPCAIVFLLDQSGSMGEEIEDNLGNSFTKAERLSQLVNKALNEMLIKCQRTTESKEYFNVLILGYGRLDENENSVVQVSWEGGLSGRTWVGVNELKANPIRMETTTYPNPKPFGPRELSDTLRIYSEPYAEGLTPMKEALETCAEFLEDWARRNQDSFPPLVFNITDGGVSDVDEIEEIHAAAEAIKSVKTLDGNALLFNFLVRDDHDELIEFPKLSESTTFEDDVFLKAMFDCSSNLPRTLVEKVLAMDPNGGDRKGIIVSSIEAAYRLLNIGTSTIHNLSAD